MGSECRPGPRIAVVGNKQLPSESSYVFGIGEAVRSRGLQSTVYKNQGNPMTTFAAGKFAAGTEL